MDIKTTAFGGFDKEAVYDVIQDLSSMYQKRISELQKENAKLRAELDEQAAHGAENAESYRQSELSNIALEAAKREAAKSAERLASAQLEIENLREELESAKSCSAAEAAPVPLVSAVGDAASVPAVPTVGFDMCSEKFEVLDAAIKTIKQSEQMIISDAKKAADNILRQAGIKAQDMLRESEDTLERVKSETKALLNLKSSIESSLSDASRNFYELYVKTEQLRRDNSQILSAKAAEERETSPFAGFGFSGDSLI